jgi:hypothetical protein
MSEKKDALMVQILFATARGAGGMRISREASAWLSGRYLPWLTAVKPELGVAPIAVWDDKGRGFLARFKEIGEQARAAAGSAGRELTVDDVATAAWQVESEADCPWCPLGPPPSGLERETALEDAIFGQIVFALARGAGEMRISREANSWFHDRYAPWLTVTKPELLRSPLEVWETMGSGFLAKFKEIGEGARAAAGTEISREDLESSAREVESEALCPHCPTWLPQGVYENASAIYHSGPDSGGLPRVQLPA